MVMIECDASETGGGDEPLGLDPFVMLAFVHESFDGLRAADLARVEPQRRADALQAALEAAAESPGDGRAPVPTLNVLTDHQTLAEAITGTTPDPAHFRDMVCRTQNGDLIDVTEAARLALWCEVRRVVVNERTTVTELGRRSRVFRGNNRDAALLLFESYVWPGCDQRVRNCQADHAVGWLQDGDTDPENACALCGRHNRFKHVGRFRARRDRFGNWTILGADGEPVG